MICGKCGKSIPEGAAFCCWCGARCGEKVCAVCGAKLRSDQLFCHECGLKCDSGACLDAGQLQGKPSFPAEDYTSSVEDGKKVQESKICKLTITRNLQCGYNERVFKVYVDNRELGNIDAGESLCADVFSDKAVVEIRYYENMLYGGGMALRVSKRIALTDMDNPKISFKVSDSAVFREGSVQYPKIETIVSGAKVLRQEQKMR